MSTLVILGASIVGITIFLWAVGAISKDILLCSAGFHKIDEPKLGCVGIIRCERRHEYDMRCGHTVVYNWVDGNDNR